MPTEKQAIQGVPSIEGLFDNHEFKLRLVENGKKDLVGLCLDISSGDIYKVDGKVLLEYDMNPQTCTLPQISLSLTNFNLFGPKAENCKLTWDHSSENIVGLLLGKEVTLDKIPHSTFKMLYVLETYWETSLDEPGYTFGEILEKLVARLPLVTYRHRRTTDSATFRRFANLAAFVDCDVIMVISSHGCKEGIYFGYSDQSDLLLQLTTNNNNNNNNTNNNNNSNNNSNPNNNILSQSQSIKLARATSILSLNEIGKIIITSPNISLIHFACCDVILPGISIEHTHTHTHTHTHNLIILGETNKSLIERLGMANSSFNYDIFISGIIRIRSMVFIISTF
jgi:hypothetical protein